MVRLRRGTPRSVSVRGRILAATLAIAAAGMGLAGGIAYLTQRDQHLAQIDDRLRASVAGARSVLAASPDPDAAGAPVARGPEVAPATVDEAVEAILARVLPAPNQASIGLVDGRAAYVPAVRQAVRLEGDDALLRRVQRETADGSVRIGTAVEPARTLRYIAAPVTVGGAPGSGLYLTAFDVDRELAELRAAFRTYALVALAALAVIGVVGWFVAGRLLAPIRRLRETASRITADEIHERIPVTGRDEVSELTVTVNDMLDRIDAGLAAQRRLLDDVRHELNTPITIVRGHLELMDADDPRDVGQVRALAIDELDRMDGLVRDIAVLAASEDLAVRPEPVDAGDLAREVHRKASAIPGHPWLLAAVADRVVEVDPARITQAWLQLCDNAAKYSPQGAEIELGVDATARGVEFWVRDHGPGIPAEALERIFERFGRVDAGRGIRGSGLGLPITRTIARAHGGDVRVTTSGAGSRFAIEVPADVPA